MRWLLRLQSWIAVRLAARLRCGAGARSLARQGGRVECAATPGRSRIRNLTVLTANMIDFEPPAPGTYDRIVSIEMFEHMKNYEACHGPFPDTVSPSGGGAAATCHRLLCFAFCGERALRAAHAALTAAGRARC